MNENENKSLISYILYIMLKIYITCIARHTNTGTILIIYIFMTGLIYFLGARANIPQCLCRSTAFWITDRDFVTIC